MKKEKEDLTLDEEINALFSEGYTMDQMVRALFRSAELDEESWSVGSTERTQAKIQKLALLVCYHEMTVV